MARGPYRRTGQSRHPLHKTWGRMIERCRNKNDQAYPRYGGRGIKVCDQWQGENGFWQFVKDMGEKPSDSHTLDRINNDGHYEPKNCRWATKKEQSNNAGHNRKIKIYGEVVSLTEAIRKYAPGLSYPTVWGRLSRGWDIEEALIRKDFRHGK